jgi:dynein heavy chain
VRWARRRHYTTPQSYLDLIELYKGLLKAQRSATGDARERLLNGLAKLGETNEQVEQMRGELSALQPVIHEKSQARPSLSPLSRAQHRPGPRSARRCSVQAAAAMQAEVVRDQAGAETVRANVAREEAAVAQTAAEAKALAEDAKADLAQALPALQAAIDSLSALNKGAGNLPQDPASACSAPWQQPAELFKALAQEM